MIMNKIGILEKVGADLDSYIFSESDPEMRIKVGIEKKIVCKLPKVFTDWREARKIGCEGAERTELSPETIKVLSSEIRQLYEDQMLVQEPSIKNNQYIVYDQHRIQNEGSFPEGMKMKGKVIKGFPQYVPKSLDDTTLGFESRFESGNLSKAIFRSQNQYDLYLNGDNGLSQQSAFFFFKIYNVRSNLKYQFTICNLLKHDCVYNRGIKLFSYSTKINKFKFVGEGIFCYQSQEIRENLSLYSSLQFKVVFEEDFDSVYLSNTIPYSYSRLKSFMAELGIFSPGLSVSVSLLCKSALENDCFLVKLELKEEIDKRKELIIINSRQHPGEALGSHLLESVLYELAFNSSNYQDILQNYDFLVCPMLNPDGVILGNQRWNSTNLDLNRQWSDPDEERCPTIYHFKRNLLKEKINGSEICLFIDIHSHSRKFNYFFYCNPLKNDDRERAYIRCLSEASDQFDSSEVTHKITKDKLNSARVIIGKELNIHDSFTLEIGHGGLTKGQFKGYHHTPNSLDEVAKSLLQAMKSMNIDNIESKTDRKESEIDKKAFFTFNEPSPFES